MGRPPPALSIHECTTEIDRCIHDAVLANGSVPLPVLEQMVEAYIAQEDGK